jgi:glutamate 5-kinase
MATKLRAAARAQELGVRSVIARGLPAGSLGRIFKGEEVGTLFEPAPGRRHARGAWIAHALKPKGTLVVDAGARAALEEKKKSLLPSGITQVEGRFAQGDPVDIRDEAGEVFARGLTAYASDELEKLRGQRTSAFEGILGYRGMDEAVHKDDLALITKA